jgi:6-phosphogluconolactonase
VIKNTDFSRINRNEQSQMTNNTQNDPEQLGAFSFSDSHRNLIVPGDRETTIHFCVNHFLNSAAAAIEARGVFAVALSGGSTPKAIFNLLASASQSKAIDWSRVLIFWSDERAVGPDDKESNYHMAMTSGISKLPIPPQNILRMQAEEAIEQNALAYEQLIQDRIPGGVFDLITLGMGDDGHTASLFPGTKGLEVKDRLVIANYIPQKKCWRMTFTFACINQARQTCIYVLGADKAAMLDQILLGSDQNQYPSQRVGTPEHKALWIADEAAAAKILGAS